MKQSNKKLPKWIERQATLGPNVEVEGKRTDLNLFWYLLTLCCPLIYESYAIILHPFWINWKAKELVESGLKLTEEQTLEEDFQRVSWNQFFKLFNKEFKLSTANLSKLEIEKILGINEWPVHIWFPEEGNCEAEEIEYTLSKIADFYGNAEANFYYCFLKTKDWNSDIIFEGKTTEFNKLKTKVEIRDNPTALYPDDKSWCIVTDYDCPFTYVGGKKEFIRQLIYTSEFEIYELQNKFKEKCRETQANSS